MYRSIVPGTSDVRTRNDLLVASCRRHQVRERPALARRLPGRNQRSSADGGLRCRRERLGPRSREHRRELPVPHAGSGTLRLEPARGSRAPGRACDPVDRRKPAAHPVVLDEPVSSWGRPIGKAVVYISPSGTRLLKVYPGTQRRDDITPVPDVRYLNVNYHPSGTALAMVLDVGESQEIWLSSNVGRNPFRLVFPVEETTFGALAFTADGRTLLYAAVHEDDAPVLHAIDLTDPTSNEGLWHGEAGDRISAISTQPKRDGRLIAFTVGSSCRDSQAMLLRPGGQSRSLAEAPSRVIGWLDVRTVLVASGGCEGPSDLAAVDVLEDATAPLVDGVEIAAARTPLLGFVPPLPPDIEEKVGEGLG